MRRSAFTLIELIFVIVIIGVLAAIAIPKFVNLKQNAEVKGVIKTTVDTVQQAAETAVNQLDLEDKKPSDVNLTDIVALKGKGWSKGDITNNSYKYIDPKSNNTVVEINFSASAREVNYSIDCTAFDDTKSQEICKKDLNTTGTVFKQLTF